MKYNFSQVTGFLEEAASLGLDISFSCNGWSVFNGETKLGGEGYPDKKYAGTYEQKQNYNKNLDSVILCVLMHEKLPKDSMAREKWGPFNATSKK